MGYLLDTHVILWWFTTPEEIHKRARNIIENVEESIFISTVSLWEMAIKQSIGRLTLPAQLLTLITKAGFQTLPILPEEGLSVADLPLLHQDPFDRLLIIQAKLHNLVLLTRDNKIKQYTVPIIEA
ncbi:MAG: hypothetical protein A3F18_08645 [Legionellales bacterium RIFCSPHIGHO2_12_FULL_37_14]|nr:MAG: hypothetical protein A3F18_08645 [Legionellales bacterium RIFCSPHIGHO2_12_FULL_37_14]